MDYCDELDAAFRAAKLQVLDYIERHNDLLPRDCPRCHSHGDHVPGLRCRHPDCRYVHPVAWAILLDTDTGYEAVAIGNRRTVFLRVEVVA